MSLQAWHDQLASVIAAATPTTKKAHLGAAFVHDRAVGGERAVGTRRFGLGVERSASRGNSRPGGTHVRFDVVCRVDYLDMPTDQASISLAMLEDAKTISDAVIDSSNWAASTTRIRVVGGVNATDWTTADMTPVLGGWRLIVRFPVEVYL